VIYLFEGYSLDSDLRELRLGTGLVALEPQVFDILYYLIRNRERVVSKDDIIAAIWNGRIVSESALTSRLTAVRHAIGDSGDEQRLIRTIPRKGLRFVGEVREKPQPGSVTVPVSESPISDKPSIAVLPFTNMSGDPEQEYFSDGITDDIITELSRNRSLVVVARHSSFAFRGKAIPVPQIGHELGANYVLEGSVRKMLDQIRLNVQLIDATTGSHVWVERYDRDLQNVFSVQDEIVATIVATLSMQALTTAIEQTRRKPPSDWRAYDYVLMGAWIWEQDPSSEETLDKAMASFQRAIEMDPHYARAYAWVAVCYNRLAKYAKRGNHDEYAKARRTCREYAEKGLSLDSSDSLALRVLGWSYIWSGRFTEGERLFERAYAMDPHLAYVAMTYVTALVYLGKPEQAITLAETTIRQDPRHRESCLYDLAEAYFFARRNRDALAVLDGLTDENFTENRAVVVAAYAYADRLDQAYHHAQRYIDELCANWKGNRSADLAEHLRWEFQHFHPQRRAEDARYLQEGLRKAGLPA
jgi:TolB-like protein/Tfp pilus assembly protein PilF